MNAKDIELLEDIHEFFDDRGDGAPDSSHDAIKMLNWTGPLQRMIERLKAEGNCLHNRPAKECVFCDPVGRAPEEAESLSAFMQRLANLCPRHARAALPRPTQSTCSECYAELTARQGEINDAHPR